MQKPLVTIALALFAGILLGKLFLFFPVSIVCSFFTAVTAVALFSRRKGVSLRTVALRTAVILSGAFITVFSITVIPGDHYTKHFPLNGSLRNITGRIVSPLERDPGRTAFLLSVERIGSKKASGTLRVVLKEDPPQVGYGDTITVPGKLYPLRGYRNPGGFDYPSHLAQQGVYAVLSVRKNSPVSIVTQGAGIFRTVQDWRERIRQAFLGATSGAASAVLQAMVLGEEGGLTNELRDTFLAAGVTHILSISGSHLGLVAMICFFIFKNLIFLLPERSYHRLTILADPRKIAAVLAVPPVLFYTLLAGGQQATIRSLIMLLAGVAALTADRDHDLLQALAFAALVVLVPAPQAAFDISFQLSYLSVAAILFVLHVAAVMPPPAKSRQQRIKRNALLLFAISVAATIATAPLVVYYFNRVSPWGVLSNMLIVPFAGMVVVPLGLFSGVLSLALDTLPFSGLNQLAGDTFVKLTSLFAGLPGAPWAFPAPGLAAATAYACLAGALALLLRQRALSVHRPLEYSARPPKTARYVALSSGIALALIVTVPHVAGKNSRVTFLDVGQGDCALVETSDGKNILIDGGGTPDSRFDVGLRVVAPFLWNRDIGSIDLAILSHPHPDHMNGLTSIIRVLPVREIWTSGRDLELKGYEEFRTAAKKQGAVIRTVREGDHAAVGNASFDVLSPTPDSNLPGQRAYEAENNRSLVIRMSLDGKRFLFPGDIHQQAERVLTASRADLLSDLLKLPHHGSKTSSSAAFLGAVRPSVAVASVGAGNPYRHPSDDVVNRCNASGIRLGRTDQDGAVIVLFHEGAIEVVSWASLLFSPLRTADPSAWWDVEQINWKRLWIRQAVI